MKIFFGFKTDSYRSSNSNVLSKMCRNIQNVVSDTLDDLDWQGIFRETYSTHPDNENCIQVRLDYLVGEHYMIFEVLDDVVSVMEIKNIGKRSYTRFLDCLVENL